MSLVILVLAVLLILSGALEPVCRKLGVPPLIGYLMLGVLFRMVQSRWSPIEPGQLEIFHVFGQIGVAALLFRVGLDSNVGELLHNLRRASPIWVANVLVSAGAGFVVTRYVVGAGLISSLFVATAMSATSVGVPTRVWEDHEALDTDRGRLFLDVAELDDISGVALMAILFALAPSLRRGDVEAGAVLGWTGLTVLKLAGFVAVCVLFSRYMEKRWVRLLERSESQPNPVIAVMATGLLLASLAGLLGLSVAMGAFFAGLVFSHDPEAVRVEAGFAPLYGFFVPFFFISIGLDLRLSALGTSGFLAVAMSAVAIGGKFISSWAPGLLATDRRAALLVGVSMVPRAEITLIVMQRGLSLGLSERLYAAMVVVVAVTCVVFPMLLDRLLRGEPGS